MIKNLWLLFMTKLVYKELNLKNLGYYGKTVAYEVISISDSNDVFDLFIYEIKQLDSQEVRNYVSKSAYHMIGFGRDLETLRPGFRFCVENTKKKQGREFIFSRYVSA